MNYKLYSNAKNDYLDSEKIFRQVLENRSVKNIDRYVNLDDGVLHDYSLLNNIELAVECLDKHVKDGGNISIIVDCDPDGYCSAAMMYNYLRRTLKHNRIKYVLHEKKKHGLSNDITIPEGTTLLIIPDAGSNDYEELKKLKDRGIDVIILDHHEAEYVSEDAIVVNNQLCDYPNKNLCGAGIVYKFLQALDNYYFEMSADDYLDLVALANIADVMDITELETKRLIDKGLENVKNPMFKAIIDKRAYDIKGQVTINNVAFYIVPVINAIIRVGSLGDKDLLFQGFLEKYQTFKYKKRGEDELVDEIIYDKVAREGINLKAKQTREMDKYLKDVFKLIENEKLSNNNLLVVNATEFNQSLTGIMAIKVASKYDRPCLMIRQKEDNTELFGGSGRNIDNNGIDDLKEYLNNTGLIMAEGHPNAFGIVELHKDNIDKLIDLFNQDGSIVQKHFYVDFIVPFDELTDDFIGTLNVLKKHWGKGIKEPYIAVENIDVHPEEVSVMGKEMNTVKINVDGIEFIKFKCDLTEKLMTMEEDFTMNIVGKCSMNDFNGKVTPQIIIEAYEIV